MGPLPNFVAGFFSYEDEWRMLDFSVSNHALIYIKYMVFGRLCATESYRRDEMDLIAYPESLLPEQIMELAREWLLWERRPDTFGI